MKLNKRNIDFCCSLDIGRNTRDQKLKMRADKLSVVSSFHNSEEKKITYKRLKKMRQKEFKKYRVQYIRNKEKKPYRKALLIRGKKKNSPVLLRIDYSPINRNTGGIRLDFRPQHMPPQKIDHLLSWISCRLGGIFYQLLERAWITQIDVALDVYNCKLDDYLWGLDRAGKTAYFDKENGLPGLRIGSCRSLLHILFYGKVNAPSGGKLVYRERTKFININFDEYQQFLRIEARYRPNATPTSKNGNALKLADLLEMKNPFERLRVYSKDLGDELLERGFLCTLPHAPSIAEMKRYMLATMQCSRLPRKVDRLIAEYEIELFDKHTVWTQWSCCVAQLSGIFSVASVFCVHRRVHNEKPE
ncbi:hypothetical protein [Pluralibacter gergoviae]|uniref:Replication initiation protein n=1 Tax=Pluralibacter gergoviae TaxID=61647 RepID=A0AAW8HKP0_PLUGE|nr:hypothetical protein [Pluralibacter gergoviae]HCR1855768.1 hypothetical protein [Enterobacter kobei]AVR02080.1 hypothetical protein A8H26_04840 [Pluralibacter gergoviae]KMK04286.1 hypothetical protein ABW08_11850 [Pluralibacter gergoviae]MDQ2308572.1 hypothetical protein [Pluralibacter gergoviae]HCR2151792.1 hypothetical protein [Enterobacter kobei]